MCLELESFTKNQEDIIKERTKWFSIRLRIMQPYMSKVFKYKHIQKSELISYVRIHYILGEPL